MSDQPPLIYVKTLGSLRPANAAAEAATRAIKDGTQVRIKITRLTANARRRAFYWVMLAVAAQALKERTDRPWDAELLHDTLKETLRLGEFWETPSGKRIFKPRSTSDRSMSEPDRARWTDRCADVLSTWLQIPVATLMDEARAQHGAD